jgi:hypothetical protein
MSVRVLYVRPNLRCPSKLYTSVPNLYVRPILTRPSKSDISILRFTLLLAFRQMYEYKQPLSLHLVVAG